MNNFVNANIQQKFLEGIRTGFISVFYAGMSRTEPRWATSQEQVLVARAVKALDARNAFAAVEHRWDPNVTVGDEFLEIPKFTRILFDACRFGNLGMHPVTPTIVQGLQSKVTAAQLFKGPPPGSSAPLLRDGPEPGPQVLTSSVPLSETLLWNEVDVDEKVRWNELAQEDAVPQGRSSKKNDYHK